jgi:formate dehydrogenase subunit beta
MVSIEDIRARARELLESGTVRAVVGYQRSSASAIAEPAFVTSADQAASLVWDPTCVHNLTLYLVNEKKKQKHEKNPDTRPLAVVVKGCDSRAVTVLLQENHVKREEVVVLGVSCEGTGVVDPRKLSAGLRGKTPSAVEFAGDAFKVTVGGKVQSLAAADLLADRCLECKMAYPTVSDHLYGDKVEERAFNERFAALDAVAAQSGQERWAFWENHFERCIRCYACRAVCPMCYCDECVVDSTSFVVGPTTTAEEKATRVHWIKRSNTKAENTMYHLVRAMHLAGRCIDCAECERVCPVNIPLRLLNNSMERESLSMFEYAPGMDASQPSLISAFSDRDPNDFIR